MTAAESRAWKGTTDLQNQTFWKFTVSLLKLTTLVSLSHCVVCIANVDSPQFKKKIPVRHGLQWYGDSRYESIKIAACYLRKKKSLEIALQYCQWCTTQWFHRAGISTGSLASTLLSGSILLNNVSHYVRFWQHYCKHRISYKEDPFEILDLLQPSQNAILLC